MKLTKPINQNRNIFQSVVGASGYRLLSIFMAALLFCGMNSQLLAASMPLGANVDANNNNAAASGDKLNSESFLKASNPNADDNQHWTLMGEIGAFIAGAALLGGAVAAGRCYEARQVKIAEEGRKAAASDDHQRDVTAPDKSSDAQMEGETIDGAAGKTIAAGSGWSEKASDSLAWLRQGVSRLGQGAYDLATLKSCWPASEVARKSLMEHLNTAHQDQVKKALANASSERTWGQFAYNLAALKTDTQPDHRTERQKKVEKYEPLLMMKQGDLKVGEARELNAHLNNEEARKKAIADLNPGSSLHEILAVLDPEIEQAIQEPLKKYATNDDQKGQTFAYFIAKNQDEFQLHPGHLFALNAALDAMNTDTEAQEIVQKMHEEVEERWLQDSRLMQEAQARVGDGIISQRTSPEIVTQTPLSHK
ncbi:MAG: hypothetical protein K2W97_00730 [Chthoniobacterales bacterium]|nr:hypothetical protein [Chthoniobacterales bacterium]